MILCSSGCWYFFHFILRKDSTLIVSSLNDVGEKTAFGSKRNEKNVALWFDGIPHAPVLLTSKFLILSKYRIIWPIFLNIIIIIIILAVVVVIISSYGYCYCYY